MSIQLSAHLSKAGYGDYSLGAESGPISYGAHHDDKATSVVMQDDWSLETTARPQAGDLSGTNEESKEECCELKSTAFVDDACTSMAAFSPLRTMDEIVVKDMSILDFMAKPYLLSDFQWTTAQPPMTSLYSSTITAVLAANTYWTNKIEGFALFRATVCFKLVINANPFQSGRLIAHFLPGVANHTESSYTAMHNCNLTAITQQPHVELDARDTSLIMKIPYVAPTDWYRLKSATERFDWGTFYIKVLSDLSVGSGGNANVDCGLYAWFEDVELAGPTVPQSGGKPKKKFKVNTMTREAAHASTTPISTALGFAAKAADSLSAVPLISSVAPTASWVLRGASGVASFFGWSKPISEAPPMPMYKQMLRHMTNCDGVDTSQTLGLFHDNKITPIDAASIRDEDEMSFSFLKQVTAFSQSVDWTTSTTSGTSLYSNTIYPLNLYTAGTTTYNTHTMNWRNGAPIFYLANHFTYWRGSVKVVLKFIKTDYHTGRVQVTWTPKGYAAATAPTLTTSNLAMRWIVDLRETNVLEVVLPWYIASNYLPVNQGSGQFDILVLNELRTPETASNTVKVLIYYGGGDDFELAGPGINPISSIFPQPFSPQAGDFISKSDAIGNTGTHSQSTLACALSHGELFTSVKQLISRFSGVIFSTWPSDNGITLWPWFAGVAYLDNATGARAIPLVGGDIISFVAPMYAFMRGSVKVAVRTSDIPATSTANQSVLAIVNPSYALNNSINIAGSYLPLPVYQGVASANYDGVYTTTGFVHSDSGNGVHSFSVPYYNMTKTSQVAVYSDSSAKINDMSNPSTILSLYGSGSTTVNKGCFVSRAAGDDFQFSYFIGCPPVQYSYA